jgi:hypothetical protein
MGVKQSLATVPFNKQHAANVIVANFADFLPLIFHNKVKNYKNIKYFIKAKKKVIFWENNIMALNKILVENDEVFCTLSLCVFSLISLAKYCTKCIDFCSQIFRLQFSCITNYSPL